MLKNYLLSALRHLRKNGFTSAIHITGLTVGLTCCLLMVLFIRHELSFDRFQANGDRIARVIMEYSFNGGETRKGDFTSAKVLPSFTRNFPEVESGTRLFKSGRVIRYEGKLFEESRFFFADSTFFSVFPSFDLVSGNPVDVLNGPQKAVLSVSTAKKYFGNENPVGRTILVGSSEMPYVVSGLAKDCPENSQIQFDILGSFSSLAPLMDQNYWNANYTTYLLLKDPSALQALQKKIPPFMKNEMRGEEGVYLNYTLEPFTKVHLYSPFDASVPNINIRYIYMIGAITLLILAIACFTYINLSTSRAMERAKEVGIRKVSGAGKKQVFWQFIGESFILTLISTLLSFAAATLLLPGFNKLAGKSFQPSGLFDPAILIYGLVSILVISFLAGGYPSLVLARFQPVRVLKGAFKNTGSGVLLRKSLLVFQFGISVFLVISTFVIQRQMQFIRNKSLGYDREHVLIMKLDQKMNEKAALIKTEIKRIPEVLAVARSTESPVLIKGGYGMRRSDMPETQEISVRANPIDDEYIKVNGLQIIAGSDLTRQDMEDVNKPDYEDYYFHFVLNESAAAALGWDPREAVGKKMFLGSDRPGEVRAVIRDFHFESLHSPVGALVLFPLNWGNILQVKTNGKKLPETIASLERIWKSLAPHRPFAFSFMDEDFQQLYKNEERLARVFSIFSAMAIFLACLGLFGLSAYAVQQRIKEIGIRKVLGASASHIILLLSTHFVKLVGLAFLFAAPLSWFVMHNWLQNFAYRIGISWWLFAAAALIMLTITLLTISFQIIKAALSNPVHHLRTE